MVDSISIFMYSMIADLLQSFLKEFDVFDNYRGQSRFAQCVGSVKLQQEYLKF